MNIGEAREFKDKLEMEILGIVRSKLNDFEIKTELSVSGISFYFTNVSTINSRKKQFVISDCKIEIEL